MYVLKIRNLLNQQLLYCLLIMSPQKMGGKMASTAAYNL